MTASHAVGRLGRDEEAVCSKYFTLSQTQSWQHGRKNKTRSSENSPRGREVNQAERRLSAPGLGVASEFGEAPRLWAAHNESSGSGTREQRCFEKREKGP